MILKKATDPDPNHYLHQQNGQTVSCPFTDGGMLTQFIQDESKLTLDNQPVPPKQHSIKQHVTCGTWCALFRQSNTEGIVRIEQHCGNGRATIVEVK